MNIFISYKQTWIDKDILKKELYFLKDNLEKLWHTVFIYYFYKKQELPNYLLNQEFLKNIKKVDLVLAYVNYENKSEWQLLELWMAYSLGKKIKVLLNQKVKKNYFLIYWLGEIIEFNNLNNIDFIKIF